MVDHMADKRIGSAVIVGPSGVVGILTAVDVMHALAEILRREAA